MISLLERVAFCFVVGSIPFAVISMWGTGVDVRQIGSGNPGFNNVLRVNKKRAVLALIGDMGKGVLAVWLVLRIWPLSMVLIGPVPSPEAAKNTVLLGWVYGFATVLGHCYSPFLKFNGGKGIATSGGVMLVLYPVWAVIALAYFALARVLLGKRKQREAGTLASLTTWILFTLLLLTFVGRADAADAFLMTLLLAWRHKTNFQKLFAPRVDNQHLASLG